PLSDRLTTATGFQKWGLAMGTEAAVILTDQLAGRDNPWASLFDPLRLRLRASAGDLVMENTNVARRFLQDRLKRWPVRHSERGEGRLVADGLGQTAVARDADGTLHAVSARCTHLGCIVEWNSGDASWDCP